jgi:hypothetical protein
MKKLIAIACLSFMGIVISSEKYSYISSHFPTKSLLRKQCEENERIGLPNYDGALVCKQIDNEFPFVAQQIRASKRPLKIIGLFFRINQPALQMQVREEMQKRFNTKAYREGEVLEIEAILGHLKLSEIDKKREYGFLRDYYVMAAEEGLRD